MAGHDRLELSPAAEEALDNLLAVPPQEFTAARNAAARQLAADGRSEAAAEIKALARPPVAVWVLNQLAREQPAVVRAFLDAAEGLREAYRSGGDIRAATAPQREAEARALAAAMALARARGTRVSETVSRGLRQTLSAAAADPDVGAALGAGRLLREPEAPSIDELLASLPAPHAEAPSASPAREAQRQRRALQISVAEAEEEAARARDAARAASDAATRAQREAERARRDAVAARERSDAAQERLEELRRQLAGTRETG
jgi:hypothetical protein